MMLTPQSYLNARPAPIQRRKIASMTDERSSNVPAAYAVTPSAQERMSESKTVSVASTNISNPVVIPGRRLRSSACDRKLDVSPRSNRERRLGFRTTPREPALILQENDRPSIGNASQARPAVAASRALTRPQRHSASSHTMLMLSVSDRVLTMEEEDDLGKSPLDVLLGTPTLFLDADDEDDESSDSGLQSFLSSRTISLDSLPSLDDISLDTSSCSLRSLATPVCTTRTASIRRKKDVVSSPPREAASQHPLSDSVVELDYSDFRVFTKAYPMEIPAHPGVLPLNTELPRKSAFKSNLTASLKALRSAARSLSSMTSPALGADDFLTRSMVEIDPQVPYTDERMPPRLADTPTPALRRYLNPVSNAPIEAHMPYSVQQVLGNNSCSASIQMQTYRVSKSSKAEASTVGSRRTSVSAPEQTHIDAALSRLGRQRDMRENSDFIRVAVMEMLMRRNGKLDERLPGKAKWALPPRQSNTRVYKISDTGIPLRWTSIAA